MKVLICAVLTAAVLLTAPAAMAEPQDAPVGMKILDFVLVRPTSFVISLVSTAVFIGTVPLTYPLGFSYDLGNYMVQAPWRYTSSRYYGNFSEYRDDRTVLGTPIAAR
jgi:hypothetical protein